MNRPNIPGLPSIYPSVAGSMTSPGTSNNGVPGSGGATGGMSGGIGAYNPFGYGQMPHNPLPVGGYGPNLTPYRLYNPDLSGVTPGSGAGGLGAFNDIYQWALGGGQNPFAQGAGNGGGINSPPSPTPNNPPTAAPRRRIGSYENYDLMAAPGTGWNYTDILGWSDN